MYCHQGPPKSVSIEASCSDKKDKDMSHANRMSNFTLTELVNRTWAQKENANVRHKITYH